MDFMPMVNAPVTIASADVLKVSMNRSRYSQIFQGSDNTQIAGCKVNSGVFSRQSLFRVLRDQDVFSEQQDEVQIIYKGTSLDSMRHFKSEVESVEEGKECGIQIKGFTVCSPVIFDAQGFQEGDVIETYEYRNIRQPLEWHVC